jgi:hypothetical protein
MKSLEVKVDYSNWGPGSSELALPLRVLDSEGGVIAEGVASSSQPANFQVPDMSDPMFVRLTWPSGKTETKKVSANSMRFGDEQISHNEWTAWAVPRLNESTPLAQTVSMSPELNIHRFDSVWLRLWRFERGEWSDVPVMPIDKYRNPWAVQLDFDLGKACWCLQLGGANVRGRMVSLPGDGRCRVLITPNGSDDPRADALKVVVTGFRRDAETLLEFLSRDALRAAHAVARFQPLATQLLAKKFDDPISAVAGAYFLLRTDWSSVPLWWFDNLTNKFLWLPDAPIIRCIVMLRGGLSTGDHERQARELLLQSLNRGVPIFAEGLTLLYEAASLLHSGGETQGIFSTVEKLAASVAWAGAAFSYYGAAPDKPSPVQAFGLPPEDLAASRMMSSGRGSAKGWPQSQPLFLREVQ